MCRIAYQFRPFQLQESKFQILKYLCINLQNEFGNLDISSQLPTFFTQTIDNVDTLMIAYVIITFNF